MLITLLVNHDQDVYYIPGRVVNSASGMYRGEGRTDARDAAVIADQIRLRNDLQPLTVPAALAVELRLLTGRREDLVMDRTRAINRLHGHLLEYFPALEAEFDFATTAGVNPTHHLLPHAGGTAVGRARPAHRRAASPERPQRGQRRRPRRSRR